MQKQATLYQIDIVRLGLSSRGLNPYTHNKVQNAQLRLRSGRALKTPLCASRHMHPLIYLHIQLCLHSVSLILDVKALFTGVLKCNVFLAFLAAGECGSSAEGLLHIGVNETIHMGYHDVHSAGCTFVWR